MYQCFHQYFSLVLSFSISVLIVIIININNSPYLLVVKLDFWIIIIKKGMKKVISINYSHIYCITTAFVFIHLITCLLSTGNHKIFEKNKYVLTLASYKLIKEHFSISISYIYCSSFYGRQIIIFYYWTKSWY